MGYYLRMKLKDHEKRCEIGKHNFVGSQRHYRLGNPKRGKRQVKLTGMGS